MPEKRRVVETERAPLGAQGVKGAFLVCVNGWMYGSAWAVLAASNHPVTGGAVFCVIFLPRNQKGRQEYSTLRKGQRSQFDVGLDDGDIFHAVQIRSSKFLGAGVCLHPADPLFRNDPSYSCPPTCACLIDVPNRPYRTFQNLGLLSLFSLGKGNDPKYTTLGVTHI